MTFDKISPFGEEAERVQKYREKQASQTTENLKRAVSKYLIDQENESKTKTSAKQALAQLDEIIEDLQLRDDPDLVNVSDQLEEVRHALHRSFSD